MEVQVLVSLVQFSNFEPFNELESLTICLYLACFLSVYCFVASIVTNNYSQVDQLWSIAPPVYSFIFVLHSQTYSVRELIALTIVTLWGVRLTYNFARKGGYSGVEDYRWEEARKMITNPVIWQIFNVSFVCIYQNFLLLSLVFPVYICTIYAHQPLSIIDFAAFGLSFFALGLETVADQQQWNFQSAKHAKLASKENLSNDFAKGFLTQGLFRYSRHPNYFAEQLIWWAIFLYSVGATGSWVHWTFIGAAQMSMLFHFTTNMTEKLSHAKYPLYASYVKTTSRIVPWFAASSKID